ncbi:hypothetical protein [Rhodococcus qingshengii]|uniref:hypothetical protein n=1 Tax=Rhodococcus qingshengii TaxID=334542 RepID=UPI001ABEF19A|nr:hypothetical protein [Rhodococcus qingshengii]
MNDENNISEENDSPFVPSEEQRATIERLSAKIKAQAAIPLEKRKLNTNPRFSENFGPIEGDDGEWYFP